MGNQSALKIYETDPYLEPYKSIIDSRNRNIRFRLRSLSDVNGSLTKKINNHLYYGLHITENGDWVFREYAPNASKVFMIGDFNSWKRNSAWELHPMGNGDWELHISKHYL